MPDQLPTVHQAWIQVMTDIGAVAKGGYNAHQKFNFRSIDDVVAAVYPALVSNGVTVIPTVAQMQSGDREGTNSRGEPTITRWATVVVQFTVTGPAGDSFVGSVPGEASDTGDKAMNKAMSFAAKDFFFKGAWLPVAQGDGDADHTEQRPARSTAQVAQASGVRAQVAQAAGRPAASPSRPAPQGSGNPVSDKQLGFIRKLNSDEEEVLALAEIVAGRNLDGLSDLTTREASALIDQLQGKAPAPARRAPTYDEPPPQPPEDDFDNDPDF